MTYNQFWFDDPQLYYIYEEAYLDELKEKDIYNWQLGHYIRFAIGSCFDKNCKYPNNPIFYACEKQKPETVFDMKEKFINIINQINKKFD